MLEFCLGLASGGLVLMLGIWAGIRYRSLEVSLASRSEAIIELDGRGYWVIARGDAAKARRIVGYTELEEALENVKEPQA